MRTDDPFGLDAPRDAPLPCRAARAAAASVLDAVLGLRTCRALYARMREAPGDRFAARALRVLDISAHVASGRLGDIPASGPAIVASNHPHGLLDGLVLAEVVAQRRPDMRVLANRLLARIPELSDGCFFVDPFEGRHRAARSRAGLRAALDWLREGHLLVIFPAGAVAGRLGSAGPIDAAWHTTVGRLALLTGAAIVPACVEGRNSALFYAAGRLHPSLRTALLPRELLKARGGRVRVHLGSAVPFAPGNRADDAAAMTALARGAVDRLQAGAAALPPAPASQVSVPVRGPVDPLVLDAEVRRLRAEHALLDGGALQVFCAPAARIPNVLQEIGRLRELTFRAVGEGTGGAVDLDRFDEHYLHLFVWNAQRREIAGAYRVGPTDTILAEHGIAGLYTSTLFQYDERLLARLSPALELGRSFVRAEYQRGSSALYLLWKGIGRLVARSMRYRVLFGPVSISSRYRDLSQEILMRFLADNHRHDELASLVTALRPPAGVPIPPGVAPQTITDAAEADSLVARLEPDGKGMPVLLRQYLRMNAKLLAFNVDPSFGDALDALMTVDLVEVDPAILGRYLGRDDAARFLRRHATAAA